jgi:hypothetical protein
MYRPTVDYDDKLRVVAAERRGLGCEASMEQKVDGPVQERVVQELRQSLRVGKWPNSAMPAGFFEKKDAAEK